jgi:tight adherence protein C
MTARVLLPLAWAVFVVGVAAALRARLGPPSRAEPGPGAAGRRARPLRRRHRNEAIGDAVPDVVDLFAVATAAGLNPRLAVAAVAERAPPGPLADALADVCRRVGAGDRLADALDAVRDDLDSDAVRPLVGALTDAERYGSTLGPTLERLADEARRSRQRRAEEAARKLPVKLLFPLVLCILPAFGLLTVAPLIAGGLRALRL